MLGYILRLAGGAGRWMSGAIAKGTGIIEGFVRGTMIERKRMRALQLCRRLSASGMISPRLWEMDRMGQKPRSRRRGQTGENPHPNRLHAHMVNLIQCMAFLCLVAAEEKVSVSDFQIRR